MNKYKTQNHLLQDREQDQLSIGQQDQTYTVEPRNSELQFSGKPRNSGQFSNDQLFIK